MNVYDTANRLASEIKESEEYVNYKMAKQALNLNSELKSKIENFDKLRYELQLEMMQTGKNNEEKGYSKDEAEISADKTYSNPDFGKGKHKIEI